MKNIKLSFQKMIDSRVMPIIFGFMPFLLSPAIANAKISDWFKNAGTEVVIIMGVVVVILGAFGIGLTGFGVVSAVFAKKNRQPLEHQGWFILGGVICVLLIPLVIGLGESISGSDPSSTVNGLLTN